MHAPNSFNFVHELECGQGDPVETAIDWSHMSAISEHGNLIINPLPNAGNKLIAINDDGSARANVQFIEFLHYGWPTVCMATLRPINEGEELVVEYGTDYWRVHKILEAHVWKPLDKLQEQRQREGRRLLEKVEETNRHASQVSAQNSQLLDEVTTLRQQLEEAQGRAQKRQRKQPMPPSHYS